jgi:uncharacterized damage-inducible protein DinB
VDKASLQDLFAYTDWAWKEIRRVVPDDGTLCRHAPGSGWPALRNCLSHVIFAYDAWLGALLDFERAPLPDLAEDDFLTWPQVEAHRARTRGVLQRSLEGWSEAELQLQHPVVIYGQSISYSRAELVLHLLLHERGHHGDVTTLFWQLGLEAETELEYRFHLRRH